MATNPLNTYVIDTSLQLKAAGLIASSAAVATILDLGEANWDGELYIQVTALEIASNDEIYDIVLQFSPDAAFGTAGNIQDGVSLSLSAKEVKRTDSDKDDVIGRYILPASNLIAGTTYRYCRLYTVVGGTIATGINYFAYLVKNRAR